MSFESSKKHERDICPSGSLPDSERPDFVYSKNSKTGILYLNSPSVLIGDTDVGKVGYRSDKPIESKEEALVLVEKCAKQMKLDVEVYETRNGIRFIVTNRPIHVGDSAAEQIFKLTQCDPSYVACCKRYGRFSARLTPKSFDDIVGIQKLSRFICSSSGLSFCDVSSPLVEEHDLFLLEKTIGWRMKKAVLSLFDFIFCLEV